MKIIQLVVAGEGKPLYALCDDGSVWEYADRDGAWSREWEEIQGPASKEDPTKECPCCKGTGVTTRWRLGTRNG